MMRYAILLAMLLLCLPVRGEAWQVVGGAVPAADVTILDDTLYEASVVALTSHTVSPGPGGSWGMVTSGSFSVSTGGAYPSAEGDLVARNAVSTSLSTPFSAFVTATAPTSGTGVGVGVFKSSASDGYLVVLDGTGNVKFFKLISGAFTQIGTAITASPWDAGIEYDIKITHSGGAWGLEVKTGDTVVASRSSISDSSHAVGDLVYPGFYGFGGATRLLNIGATND